MIVFNTTYKHVSKNCIMGMDHMASIFQPVPYILHSKHPTNRLILFMKHSLITVPF